MLEILRLSQCVIDKRLYKILKRKFLSKRKFQSHKEVFFRLFVISKVAMLKSFKFHESVSLGSSQAATVLTTNLSTISIVLLTFLRTFFIILSFINSEILVFTTSLINFDELLSLLLLFGNLSFPHDHYWNCVITSFAIKRLNGMACRPPIFNIKNNKNAHKKKETGQKCFMRFIFLIKSSDNSIHHFGFMFASARLFHLLFFNGTKKNA